MTVHAAMAPAELVPANAPFSDEQRAWLSGFLAASLGAIARLDAVDLPGIAAGALAGPPKGAGEPPLASNDEAPWHDPSLAAEERMALAKDRALAPRLMAAMAQQDCGQCGYSCADYANAIFLKREERLNLCAPGGKETFRIVKRLAEALGNGQAPAAKPAAAAPAEPLRQPVAGTSRESPVEVAFLSRRRLNAEGSEKRTHHIEFDLAGSGLDYQVGDSFGIFPKNHLGHVDQVIAMLGVSHAAEIRGRSLREVLTDEVSLGVAPDRLFDLFSYLTGGATREKARALARGDDPDGDAATLDVFAVLQKFGNARPHPEAFVDALEPLQPRLYSISSSPKAASGRLSLTVDVVRYMVGKRCRLGVASTYLGERAAPGEPIKAYVQKAHGFALPADPATPIIMIGPGTGIAPFRAFLSEREAIRATGANWLFFGHQRQATDFFYRDELRAMSRSGLLTRLSLAWSRDGDRKYLRAGSHARGWRRAVAVARQGRPCLRLRRRQAHGQGRRGGPRRRGRCPWRARSGRRGGFRRLIEEGGPIPSRCLLR